MIYLDANVFMFAILSEGKKSEICKTILRKIADNKFPAFTSLLTWGEVTWATRKLLGVKNSLDEGAKFVEFPYLKFVEVNEIIINIAQDMTKRYSLKPRNAIHAATAAYWRAEKILTDDSDFDAVREIIRVPVEKFSAE